MLFGEVFADEQDVGEQKHMDVNLKTHTKKPYWKENIMKLEQKILENYYIMKLNFFHSALRMELN